MSSSDENNKSKRKNGNIVLCAELKHQKCGTEDYKDFKPKGLLYDDYVHESVKWLCPKCGIKFEDEPIFGVKTSFFDGNGNGNGKGDKSNSKPKPEPTKPLSKIKEISINKYSGNDRLPLHESVVIGLETKFVTMQKNDVTNEPFTLLDLIEVGSEILIPKGNIDTETPLSYTFTNNDELTYYLNLAKSETLDTLMQKVDMEIRKFVDAEEHYYTIMTADIIWSYFQDRFPYTHYLIFLGDNGTGKNSALIFFRLLGYRVFYVVSASAANYFTALGNKEEGQVTIAEDEADDIGDPNNKEKRNALKAGYCSGASIPKVELEGKYTKGIVHRGFKLKMVYGEVPYNIKDVLRDAGDPEYKDLRDKLIHLR